MAWSPNQKQKTRERILQSAATLFTVKGFEKVSIDEVMQNAGLTRGGFYAHFDSKEGLYSEAIQTAALMSVHAKMPDKKGSSSELLSHLVSQYLSVEHLQPEHPGCPLAFLATDVAIQEPAVRETYTQIYKRLVFTMAKLASASAKDERIYALSALMIGGVVVARTLQDEKAVEQLLAACERMSRQWIDEMAN